MIGSGSSSTTFGAFVPSTSDGRAACFGNDRATTTVVAARIRPKKRMREIAETHVRYGYRRIHVLLRREGWDVNAKRAYRLYKELGLQLRHKPPKLRGVLFE